MSDLRKVELCLWVLFLLFCARIAAAQDAGAVTQTRPKIGLALSGGSARGLAHIGVIQWLEEHRIPIDYVAGTSMGGLVGGLYASGKTGKDMQEFVEGIDWESALSTTPFYKQLAFRRKQDAVEFPSAIEVGFRNGRLILPSGLSGGHAVGMVINKFGAPLGDLASFDDLPIPFRCVATDLVTGQRVVFNRGSLPLALRSTMSLPGIFAPVQDGNRLLVDGGLVENIPVSVVRDMGADLVIAVALPVPPDPATYQSLLGVAGASLSVMIAANEGQSLKLADMVIAPDLASLRSNDYLRAEEFRKAGYAAAELKAAMLSRFSIPLEEWEQLVKARQAKRRQYAAAESVRIEGNISPRRKKALEDALLETSKMPDAGGIEYELAKLTGMGRYDSATYLLAQEAGHSVLVVTPHEKTHGPPFFRPSLTLDAYNGGGARFGMGGRLTFLDALGPASEWRTDFNLGTDNRLASEYYWRIKGGKWFLAPGGFIEKRAFPLYQGEDRVADFDERRYAGSVDAGYAFGRFQEFRTGYVVGHLKTSLTQGDLDTRPLRGSYSTARTRWSYDGQDSPYIARHGFRGSAEGSWFTNYPGVERQFAAFRANGSFAHTIAPRWSMLARGSVGTTVNETSLYNFYSLGGLFEQSALAYRQFLGNNLYTTEVYALRSLNRQGLSAFAKLYGLVGYEMGRAWIPGQSKLPRHGGVMGLAGETQLGVLFVGLAVGDQGDRKLLFRLGRVF
jgi:NTE family protein